MPRKRKPIGKLLLGVFKLTLILVIIAIPVFGVWIASSLATYLDGPRWLAFCAGMLMFPVAPTVWEIRAELRYRRRGKYEVRYLTGLDRIIVRTLVLNTVFVAGILIWKPNSAFTALSARGDWMLDGRSGKVAETIRSGLFHVADLLEWMHELTHPNPYEIDEGEMELPVPDKDDPDQEMVDTADAVIPPDTAPLKKVADAGEVSGKKQSKDASVSFNESAKGSDSGTSALPPTDTSEKTLADDAGAVPDDRTAIPATEHLKPSPVLKWRWPLPSEIHAVVRDMPESAKQSPQSVGDYIAARVTQPFEQVKAIHDYVINRVYYDFVTLDAGGYPPYNPYIANKRRKGVCAGYAKLFKAIAGRVGFNVA